MSRFRLMATLAAACAPAALVAQSFATLAETCASS